jgi:aldose sugar dehydrogenase
LVRSQCRRRCKRRPLRRAFQADADQPLRGNHNGGVVRVGHDGKVYVIIGDNGRRGQTQNLFDGPFGPGIPDDQFGGPEPDDAHLTGVILRLNPDGTAPKTNPFFKHGADVGGEVGANLQKIYAYGVRNSFGLAFDPVTHRLWEQENGDDSFSELNLVEEGLNSGWVQIMGPVSRVAQFKAIETDPTAPQPFAAGGYFGLQQIRWLPTLIADTPAEALSRLVMYPGAHFSDPELAWTFEVGPGGIGFLQGNGLGREYKNDLFMGGSRNFLEGGHLFRIELSANRKGVRVSDPRLEDLVADNLNKWDITESESLLFGRNFGIGTDIQSGPNGNLYVVSTSLGAVYEIFKN